MTQTIRTHVPVPGIGPDCDVHVRTETRWSLGQRRDVTYAQWLAVYSHARQAWIFPSTQQSVTAALTAAKVVLR